MVADRDRDRVENGDQAVEQPEVVQGEQEQPQPRQRRGDHAALDDIADEGVEEQQHGQRQGRLHQPGPADRAEGDVHGNPEQDGRQQRPDRATRTARRDGPGQAALGRAPAGKHRHMAAQPAGDEVGEDQRRHHQPELHVGGRLREQAAQRRRGVGHKSRQCRTVHAPGSPSPDVRLLTREPTAYCASAMARTARVPGGYSRTGDALAAAHAPWPDGRVRPGRADLDGGLQRTGRPRAHAFGQSARPRGRGHPPATGALPRGAPRHRGGAAGHARRRRPAPSALRAVAERARRRAGRPAAGRGVDAGVRRRRLDPAARPLRAAGRRLLPRRRGRQSLARRPLRTAVVHRRRHALLAHRPGGRRRRTASTNCGAWPLRPRPRTACPSASSGRARATRGWSRSSWNI